MEVPNSYLPSGSLRGYLLATVEGKWNSTAKSSSASKWYSIWTHCLSTDVGSIACNSTHGRRSQLCDLDKVGSCSHPMAGQRYTRASYSASNNAHITSKEGATRSATVGKATGGWFMSSHMVCPLTPKLSSSRCSIVCSY